MKRQVYIESSVVSYFAGRPSRDVVIAGRQQSTQDFWPLLSHELVPHVSALVVKEAGQGDPEMSRKRLDAIASCSVLATTPDAERLAREILDGHGIPDEHPEDALHVAIAAVAGMEFIVTWNFSHINNPFTKMMIRQIVENAGYECPEIVPPDAFLGDEP
jgi:hypothetical protein